VIPHSSFVRAWTAAWYDLRPLGLYLTLLCCVLDLFQVRCRTPGTFAASMIANLGSLSKRCFSLVALLLSWLDHSVFPPVVSCVCFV
jgi:hypothetical protein